MANAQLGLVVRHIRQLATVRAAEEQTDGQLLQRFTQRHEEEAFALLLRRHGPMVLGVCRRVLRHVQDAEDAFQATFLLLAHKSGAIRKQESVGSWLHGVAHRLALRALARRERRKDHERQAATMRKPQATLEVAWQELQAVLDEELLRLPEKYRAPLVLSFLEGKTREETARQLGCPVGTVAGSFAVWTGTRLLVWGGRTQPLGCGLTRSRPVRIAEKLHSR